MKKSIVRIGGRGKGRGRAAEAGGAVERELRELDTRVAMIQALIPLGLKAVNEVLQEEVTALVGARYSRTGGLPGYARWGGQGDVQEGAGGVGNLPSLGCGQPR